MRLFRWSRGAGDLNELEARLRAERPEPGANFVERLAGELPGRRPVAPAPRYRLQLAAGATAVLIAAVATLGGLASPVTAVDDLVFDRAADVEASQDQYAELVTICVDGVTLRVPADQATGPLGACPLGVEFAGQPAAPAAPAPAAAPAPEGEVLAFTGLGLGVLALAGLVSLVVGLLGLRATRRR